MSTNKHRKRISRKTRRRLSSRLRKHGGGALHNAARSGDLEKVKNLIDSGANIDEPLNVSDKNPIYEFTPLMLAAAYGHMNIVNFLIQKGANLNYQTQQGITPLIAVLKTQEISKKSPDEIPISQIINRLVAEGADVNVVVDRGQNTPLIFAIVFSNIAAVNALLNAGVNSNHVSHLGMTALHYAVNYRNNPEMVSALLAAGANADPENASRTTPLIYAVRNRNMEIINMLINAGANVNQMNNGGRTPLLEATTDEIRNRLIEAGAVEQAPVVQPAGVGQLGVAFEIHNMFHKINKNALFAYIESKVPTVQTGIPTPATILPYIKTTMNGFADLLDEPVKTKKRSELATIYGKIQNVKYTPETIKILFYSLEFAKHQPVDFQKAYVITHTDECMHAYTTGTNTSSCTKGMIERFVTSLTTACKMFEGTAQYVENDYNTLVSILNPILMKDLIHNYFTECTKEEGFTEPMFRACIHENVKQQLGNQYDEAALTTELDRLIPTLGIFEGGGKRKVFKSWHRKN